MKPFPLKTQEPPLTLLILFKRFLHELDTRYSQSHLGWHFRMLFQSKAQSSNVSFHWNVAKETFKLWALSFRKCHPKWDWLYYLRTSSLLFSVRLRNGFGKIRQVCTRFFWRFRLFFQELKLPPPRAAVCPDTSSVYTLHHSATHCHTLQHTATHCNKLQHNSTHCRMPERTANCSTHCNTLQHTHPPSPSKFTPFCLEGLVQYMSLSADPRALLCKRHV